MFRLLVLVCLAIAAQGASIRKHKLTKLDIIEKLIIGLLDGDVDENRLGTKAENRNAYLIQAGPGNITVFPQFYNPDDNTCKQKEDCEFEITLYDAQAKETPVDLKAFYWDGSEGIEIRDLKTDGNGRCYYVRTCRVEDDDTLSSPNQLPGAQIINDRCSCHRCKLFDTQEAMDNNNQVPDLPFHTSNCARLSKWNEDRNLCTDDQDPDASFCN